MAPDTITKLLQAGCNVDLETGYAPKFIDEWVRLAVEHDVHLTVTSGYAPNFVLEWARVGGKNFTYRVRS